MFGPRRGRGVMRWWRGKKERESKRKRRDVKKRGGGDMEMVEEIEGEERGKGKGNIEEVVECV